tara:strand:- start:1336 stop:2034 length:699 start_codon:yes stop_codon:yes gene_type:complete
MSETGPRTDVALAIAGVERSYREGEGRLTVLRGVDLVLQPGELVALVAPSGAGKSTLLHIAALLERPDRGTVSIGGVDTTGLGDSARTDLRRSSIGMIYQFHHLLPDFTALENVTLPMRLAGVGKREAEAAAMALLTELGVAPRASHRPGELSGGERQRVAIARAVANRPAVLLADEPTGNLDPATAEHVFAAFVRLARSTGLAALVATHNPELAARMDRRVTLVDGLCQSM